MAPPVGKSLIEGHIEARYEFHVMGADLLALPESVEGFKYVLVVVDHFTRFAWAVPI
jgi:hypothetical protein